MPDMSVCSNPRHEQVSYYPKYDHCVPLSYMRAHYVLLTLSTHAQKGYSTQFVCQSVSHSVTQQKAELENGSLLKIETSIKMLH